MMNRNGTPVDILNKEVVQFTMDIQEDSKEGKSSNWIKYYIDRIKRGDTKGIENMGIAPDGTLCIVFT